MSRRWCIFWVCEKEGTKKKASCESKVGIRVSYDERVYIIVRKEEYKSGKGCTPRVQICVYFKYTYTCYCIFGDVYVGGKVYIE